MGDKCTATARGHKRTDLFGGRPPWRVWVNRWLLQFGRRFRIASSAIFLYQQKNINVYSHVTQSWGIIQECWISTFDTRCFRTNLEKKNAISAPHFYFPFYWLLKSHHYLITMNLSEFGSKRWWIFLLFHIILAIQSVLQSNDDRTVLSKTLGQYWQ